MAVVLQRSKLLDEVPGIVAGFSKRSGGVSPTPYESLNLAHGVGDARENVEANRRAVLHALGRPDARLITLKQVHGDDIVEVNHLAGRSISADGLWTRDHHATIGILVADCVPILIANDSGSAVAAVHAGWRGTEAKIARRIVHRLQQAGFEPGSLRVAMGSAIGPCCFVIGDEVAAQLRDAYPEIAASAVQQRAGGTWVADLWMMNRRAMLDAGVAESNIEVVGGCTSCDSSLFSYRREQGQTGRQGAIIGFSAE